LSGIYHNQKPFPQHSSNAGASSILKCKGKDEEKRAALGSSGSRRRIIVFRKLSML